MYIRQIIKDESNSWVVFLKLFFTIIIIFVFTSLFSLPHFIAMKNEFISKGWILENFILEHKEYNETMINLQALSEMESLELTSLMQILEPNYNLFLMLLGFVGMLLAVILCNKFINGNSFRSLTTSRNKIDFNRIFYSFFIWGLFSAFMIVLGYLSMPENYVVNFNLEPFLILVLIVIILLPIQTSAEEYVFRGYIMQNLGLITRNRWFPLIASSVAFGLLHGANPEIEKFGNIVFIFYIGSGLFAGIMTLMDEGMELALGWHAANNMVAALLVTADWTALQTHSVLKDISTPESMPISDVLIPVLIFFPLMLYIFAKKYNWSDWKGKLFGKI
tara:strand:- start:366 stop:1367 length:1002 start_codon:yes stop_codon:yes gene_type:complete